MERLSVRIRRPESLLLRDTAASILELATFSVGEYGPSSLKSRSVAR